MADVRFTLDHHQLRLVIQEMEDYLKLSPGGEIANLLYSIVETLVVRLRKRLAETRSDYKLILPVHQAIAIRRMAMNANDRHRPVSDRMAMQMLLADLDPKMTKYTRA